MERNGAPLPCKKRRLAQASILHAIFKCLKLKLIKVIEVCLSSVGSDLFISLEQLRICVMLVVLRSNFNKARSSCFY